MSSSVSFEARYQQLLEEGNKLKAVELLYSKGKELREKDLAFDQSVNYLKQAQIIAEDVAGDSLRAHIALQLGRAYEQQKSFGAALVNYLKASDIFSELDEVFYAHSLSNTGELFFKLGEYPMALTYYRKALQFKKKYPFKCNLPYAFWCMAEVNYALKEQDSSWYYYELSSIAADTIRQIPHYGNEGLAQLLIDQKEYHKALEYLKPVRNWYEGMGVAMWEADMGILYMKIYQALNKPNDFKYWAAKTKRNAYRDFLPEQQERYHQEMYKFYKSRGLKHKALGELELAVEIQKGLRDIWNKSNLGTVLMALKTKEAELKDSELNRVQKSNELLEAKSFSFLLVCVLLGSILTLIAIFSLLVWKKNKKIEKQLVHLKEKDNQMHQMRMQANYPCAIFDQNLQLIEGNSVFKEMTNLKAESSLKMLLSEVEVKEMMNRIQSLQHYEKVVFRWYKDRRNSKVVSFTLTQCFNDPSVVGYLLEGEDITQEIAKREVEKLALIQQLKEKEEEVNSSHQQAAMTNLQLALKKEVFSVLENKLERTKVLPLHKQEDLRALLQKSSDSDKHWEQFIHHFDLANFEFFKRLKKAYPQLTQNEDKHCVFIKMKLSTKEVANIMGITPDSVKKARQRLKKKMGMQEMQEMKNYIETL
ncbi:tetratricopeptide repeat protein [Lishizhenia tianjinensis]|nr:tetratricopeptide repeat protein [Lishizhenia tianjinensis]